MAFRRLYNMSDGCPWLRICSYPHLSTAKPRAIGYMCTVGTGEAIAEQSIRSCCENPLERSDWERMREPCSRRCCIGICNGIGSALASLAYASLAPKHNQLCAIGIGLRPRLVHLILHHISGIIRAQVFYAKSVDLVNSACPPSQPRAPPRMQVAEVGSLRMTP